MRNAKPALQEGDYFEAMADKSSIFSFVRTTENDTVIVVVNMGSETVESINIDLCNSGLNSGAYVWWELMSKVPRMVDIDNNKRMFIPQMDPFEVIILSPCLGPGQQEIEIDLKVFLEGPFNDSDMNSELVDMEGFPLAQPYSVSPWYYMGTESIIAPPAENIVDWILIELRETAGDSSTATIDKTIAQKVCLSPS
ncbi:MAG: hypothetical protein R2764_00690 [Bacteroidales bacterium]